MGESADAKKLLLPYLQRADELQKHEPLVAYYCKASECLPSVFFFWFASRRVLTLLGQESLRRAAVMMVVRVLYVR